MNAEILKIQKMVAEGKISPEESSKLIDSLKPQKTISEKETKFLKYWEGVRVRGQCWFILQYGIMGFGGGCILIDMLFTLSGFWTIFGLSNSETTLQKFMFSHVFKALLGGALFGFLIWYGSENRFRKLKGIRTP